MFTTGLYRGLLRETLLSKSTSSVAAVRAAILPPLKEPPQLQVNAGLPFFRGLVFDRLNLLPSRPFLHPPPPFPLKDPMADRGKAPPRNSSRYLSISEEWKGKSVCYMVWIIFVTYDAHTPCRGRGQPWRTALLTRMLRAAFTTACCPALSPQLLGDSRCDDGDEEEEVVMERLAVTREMMASSTRGTTTAFQSRASHLKNKKQKHSQTEWVIKNTCDVKIYFTGLYLLFQVSVCSLPAKLNSSLKFVK